MKDFDISRIVTEITSKYHFEPIATKYFETLCLVRNYGEHPPVLIVNENFNYYSAEVQCVYDQINRLAECAETYAGELDQWADREKQRVQKRVMLELYNKYMTA